MQGRWIPAKVVSRADTPHSYIVETQSGKKYMYRRNRRHLMKYYQDNESSFDDFIPLVENPAQEEERNDGELNTEVEPPPQETEENELAEFELEDNPESAMTDTEDTHEEQVTQDELEVQPQTTFNA